MLSSSRVREENSHEAGVQSEEKVGLCHKQSPTREILREVDANLFL
jgi:hypothetical protein